MPSDNPRFQLEIFGGGNATVLDADGRALSASVVVREPKVPLEQDEALVHFGMVTDNPDALTPWCGATDGLATIMARNITCPKCRYAKNLSQLTESMDSVR